MRGRSAAPRAGRRRNFDGIRLTHSERRADKDAGGAAAQRPAVYLRPLNEDVAMTAAQMKRRQN